MQYYIPAHTIWAAGNVANAYLNKILKLHGLPRYILLQTVDLNMSQQFGDDIMDASAV